MTNRRAFIRKTATITSLLALPASWPTALLAQQQLPRRPIPGTGDSLPVIGLGNSNAFRTNDVPGSTALIKLFHENGGAYVDCSGDSRFVVANVARSLGIGNDLFLGTYFTGDDERSMRENIQRLTGNYRKKATRPGAFLSRICRTELEHVSEVERRGADQIHWCGQAP